MTFLLWVLFTFIATAVAELIISNLGDQKQNIAIFYDVGKITYFDELFEG